MTFVQSAVKTLTLKSHTKNGLHNFFYAIALDLESTTKFLYQAWALTWSWIIPDQEKIETCSDQQFSIFWNGTFNSLALAVFGINPWCYKGHHYHN